MAAARNSWHRLVCADQIMTLLPVNILLLVAAESAQCTMYTLYIPWNIKTNRVSDGSSLKNTFYVGFWQWKPARLLTFIPCRFPLIPVPPTGFTGWRPNFAQSSGARSRNLQEFANWAAPPPVGCCWAAFHDNRTNRRALGSLRVILIISCVSVIAHRPPGGKEEHERIRGERRPLSSAPFWNNYW